MSAQLPRRRLGRRAASSSTAPARRRPRCSCAARGCSTRARASTGVATCSSATGEIAEIGADARGARGRGGRRGRGAARVPGVRRPARAPAHARARGRGGHRLRHARGGRRRLLRDPRAAEHRPGRRLGAGPALAARAGARRGAHPDRLHGGHHRRPAGRAAHRDGRAGRRRARPASPTTACRCARPGVMRQALQYQRLAGRVLALHEEDPSLSAGGVMHEGEVSALLGLGGDPVGVRVDDGRARLRARRLRGGAHPRPARLRARDRRGARAGEGGRRAR